MIDPGRRPVARVTRALACYAGLPLTRRGEVHLVPGLSQCGFDWVHDYAVVDISVGPSSVAWGYCLLAPPTRRMEDQMKMMKMMKKKKKRETYRDRDRDRQTERERQIQRDRDRDRETEKE